MTDSTKTPSSPPADAAADATENTTEDAAQQAVPGLRFVTRGVTPTEAAAVSAVLHGLVREESDNLRLAPARGQSAWQRSQRGIRLPVTAGNGRWRGFLG
jgi:hypothetical protein